MSLNSDFKRYKIVTDCLDAVSRIPFPHIEGQKAANTLIFWNEYTNAFVQRISFMDMRVIEE